MSSNQAAIAAQPEVEDQDRLVFDLAYQLTVLLRGHSKSVKKRALGQLLSSMGLRAVPIGIPVGTRPSAQTSVSGQTVLSNKKKVQAPHAKAAYKQTEEWKMLHVERQQRLIILKGTENGTVQNNEALASLREVEQQLKDFKIAFISSHQA